jgi:hypothetical protein
MNLAFAFSGVIFRSIISALAFFAATNAATAATIMTFPLGGTGMTVVTVSGKLELGDADIFRQKIAALPKALVSLQSDGGSTIAAIEIGKLIRLRQFSTLVPDNSRCASACALAWLGGAQRFMGETSLVGFHATYNSQTGRESGPGNALVGAYLNQIGLSNAAIFYITRTPPDSISWLNRADAEKFGIEVSVLEQEISPEHNRAATRTAPAVRAKNFITALYRAMSDSSDSYSRALNDIYAEDVHYYGKNISRMDVVTQTRRFLARWPVRQYRADESSIRVNCDHATLICDVSGELQFDAQSAVRNEHSIGRATFEYRLQLATGHPTIKILAEGGAVLKRDKQPLASRNISPFWSSLDQQ